MTVLNIPELCLVALVGASGCGKSTFAKKYFKATEVISSDFCRGLVSDDENDQSATNDAFEVLNFIAGKRLSAGRLTVIDATNVQEEARKQLVELAKKHHVFPVAIVFNLGEDLCHKRNEMRPDRQFGPHVVRRQYSLLRRSLRGLQREGFRIVHVLTSEEEVDAATIERTPLWSNKKQEHGPFDIVGDVHGCYDELRDLLIKCGYEFATTTEGEPIASHPQGRKAVFVGDLVDRGPNTPAVLKLAMSMVRHQHAYCVPGNHDIKLMRALNGRNVQITHGLKESLDQLAAESDQTKHDIARFIDKLIGHLIFDDGKLVVAHAGLKEAFQGRTSNAVREFALYGETTGETDEYGLPVRYNWAQDYRGNAHVVYGHTPVVEPEWLNKTVCLDTGCVFGGKLTALRYPEMEFVSVQAARMYYEPVRPLGAPGDKTAAREYADLLDIDDVLGKRIVNTRLRPNITIREENAIAALEVMSRFAIDPRWLVYLPPTMSPCETSKEPELLEHPAQAFEYYKRQGIDRVVCEEKHMGSRAIVVVCHDDATAAKRFGVTEESGVCYTRTGRRFFSDLGLEAKFIDKIRSAITAAGFWEKFGSDWFVFDCELMPWSAKAQELLRQQFAPVGVAATVSLNHVTNQLKLAEKRLSQAGELAGDFARRLELAQKYREAYRRYCWPVSELSGLKLAPFHLLASEGKTYFDKTHVWHMDTLARLAASDGLIIATPYQVVDVSNEASVNAGIDWWQQLTGIGGEGMVVKPMDFIAYHNSRPVQPAVKCRGPEYLRIIYGPEYTLPNNLERLRKRGLASKRSLADREFALGVEAVERFVNREPLYKVHECVFGVLALESEPVDPRL